MSSRSTRAQIARDTVEIMEQGSYATSHGENVSIREALQTASKNTVHYRPEDFPALFEKRDRILRTQTRYATAFQVVNATTLSAARELVEHTQANVLCLNFASAKNAGGGFLNGSQAQEESLARASGLYTCLLAAPGYYTANRMSGSSLYTDNMIYSPRVPVFRDDDDVLLAEPYTVSFITAPAVNVGAVKHNEKQHISRIESVMLERMEKVLSVAVAHQHDTLVLGAWGCGVFENDPAEVARWFHQHLGEGLFKQVFKTVVFAVWDRSKDHSNFRPFQERFAHVSDQG